LLAGCCCCCCCCFVILGSTLVDCDVTSLRFTIFFPWGLITCRDPESFPVECGALIPVSFPADCGALIPALTSSIVDCLRGEGVVLLICLTASPPRGEIPKPARTGDRGDLWTTVPLGGGWMILISEMDLVASMSMGSSSMANVEFKLLREIEGGPFPISHCSSSLVTRVTVSFRPPCGAGESAVNVVLPVTAGESAAEKNTFWPLGVTPGLSGRGWRTRGLSGMDATGL